MIDSTVSTAVITHMVITGFVIEKAVVNVNAFTSRKNAGRQAVPANHFVTA
jgi:hypothetical protein